MSGIQSCPTDTNTRDAYRMPVGGNGQLDVLEPVGQLDAPERGSAAPGDDRSGHDPAGRDPRAQGVRDRELHVGVDVGEEATPGRSAQLVARQEARADDVLPAERLAPQYVGYQ